MEIYFTYFDFILKKIIVSLEKKRIQRHCSHLFNRKECTTEFHQARFHAGPRTLSRTYHEGTLNRRTSLAEISGGRVVFL